MKASEKEIARLKTDLRIKKEFLARALDNIESLRGDIASLEKTLNLIESCQLDLFDEFDK